MPWAALEFELSKVISFSGAQRLKFKLYLPVLYASSGFFMYNSSTSTKNSLLAWNTERLWVRDEFSYGSFSVTM